MRLLLIRHGESVDNVAGVYAGSRDSPLTAHGALQAERLASSFASSSMSLTHIFTSPLQRAAKTAQIIRDAQNFTCLDVVRVDELREKDFGSAEGQSYRSKSNALQERTAPPSGVESNESMTARMLCFYNGHLEPLFHRECESGLRLSCAIVAHGIILSVLVRVLLGKAAHNTAPQPLYSWSNTGYLDMIVSRTHSSSSLEMCITNVNCTAHLVNLRKTRGGIGSAPLDRSQRTMHQFFTPQSSKDSTEKKW